METPIKVRLPAKTTIFASEKDAIHGGLTFARKELTVSTTIDVYRTRDSIPFKARDTFVWYMVSSKKNVVILNAKMSENIIKYKIVIEK